MHRKGLLHHLLKRPKATIFELQDALKRVGIPIAITRTEETAAMTLTEGMTTATVTSQIPVQLDHRLATCLLHANCLQAAIWIIVTAATTDQDTPTSHRVARAQHSHIHRQRAQNRDRTPRRLSPLQTADMIADMDPETLVEAETSTEEVKCRPEDPVDEVVIREMMHRVDGRATADVMAEMEGI